VGLLAYFVSLPGLLGLMQMTPWIMSRLGIEFETPAYAELFSSVSGPRLVGLLLLAVVVQPFFEELLFRGFLQPVLVARTGPAIGIGLTSALFASMHGVHFLPIFGFSILLGGLGYRTRRLAACVGVHALHNALELSRLFVEAPTQVDPGWILFP
jgi:membrane protease YdiL (CAAX protease family)